MIWLLCLLLASCDVQKVDCVIEEFSTGRECSKKSQAPKEEFGVHLIPACTKGFSNTYHKRKAPPEQYLKDLFSFVQKTCWTREELYGVNNEPRDVFVHLKGFLTVTRDKPRRCANMFELLRVSAAMESSYNWQEGRDKNASNYDLYTQEAGIFQTSPNSHVGPNGRWEYLDDLVAKHGIGLVSKMNEHENEKWNFLMKDESKKDVIFEHHAFMLRHNYRHYGPMIDFERVGKNISKKCIEEVERVL